MKKLITSLLLHLLATSFLFAQTGNGNRRDAIFNVPSSAPAPRWVTDTDWEHPNIFKIDAAIAAYEPSEEEKTYEKRYRLAYMRWRKTIEPFIQADGSVVEQPGYYDQVLKDAINAQGKKTGRAASARTAGNANWTVLGPIETYTEQKTKISLQVNIYTIAIAPSNPNILYAGSESGVIFRSIDKGLHWVSISDALPPFSATSIAVDPSNADIVYATSDKRQIIKTHNGGSEWSFLTSYNGGLSEKITINQTSGRILVAGDKGVYYSDDQGATWQLASGSSADRIWDVEINPVNTNIVYAVGRSQTSAIMIFHSTNGGASFTTVNSSSLNNVSSQDGARIGVTPANGNTVYCITLGGPGVAPRLLKSTDAGANWNITFTGGMTYYTFGNHQGFYDLDILVSPHNENHLITGIYEPFKSVDGGFTFSSIKRKGYPIHADVQCIRAAGNDTYLCTDGGIDHSTDFFTDINNWSTRNYGLTGTDYWGFAQGWDQDIVVGGRYHNGDAALFENYETGNALSVFGGAEEPTGHVFHGQKNTVGFMLRGRTLVIPSSLPGSITRAKYQNSKWPQDLYYGAFSSKLMIDPSYSNTYYVGRDNALWKSVSLGVSYTALHDFGSKVWRFDIARSNHNVIYVCTENGIYKTTDGGQQWTSLSLPSGVTYRFFNADIAVDQLNENVVFLCMAEGNVGQKVFKSTDGGVTWTNYTGMLTTRPIAFIVPQAGTNGGVYAITNSPPAKVYYRDNTMADWLDYSSGLPQNFYCRQGGIIFYRDNKLRVAGNRGVWESPLYSAGTPVAQPMADRQMIKFPSDTVYFTDYSNLIYSGATWKWSFPGASYVSSTTVREPKVLYPSPGSYSVTLEVTDASGNTHSRTINNMVTLLEEILPDPVAGKCFQTYVLGNRSVLPMPVNLGKANINSDQFSISCWIKPNGLQSSSSRLITCDPYPGSGNKGLELMFKGGNTPNLELAYTDANGEWASGLTAESDTWNHVVLTYSPTGVKIYLNGVPASKNGTMPVIDLSQLPFFMTKDNYPMGYNGAIDEVKFYNYALSQEEVREKMHLIPADQAEENGLIKYFQFNQHDYTDAVPDLMSKFEATITSICIAPSTAPVATGKVFRKPDVNAAGLHSFPGTGIDLTLKNGATYPNGEVVAFQLDAAPDHLPDTLPLVPASKYFIIHNYGSNKTFTAPESIRFSGLDIETSANSAALVHLYQRPSGASGNTWGNELSHSPGNSSVTFGADNNITTFGQLALSASPLKAVDTVAGKCFTTVNNSYSPIDLGTVPINSNEFSVSCWIKPDTTQKSFSQLISHDPYPGSQYGFGLGFAFRNYARNLELVYTDNTVGYGNLSNLVAENDTWSYVVLTYSSTGVTIYLNGVPKVVKSGAMPVIDLSQAPFYVNKDIHGQGGDYKGAIDEIKFYNYALSQEEVREKMHLIQKYPALENGLLKYFQFNQYNGSTGKVPDLMSDFEATIPNTSFITASTAPVATGKVFRNPDVNAAGLHSFPGTGIDLTLKSGATYPNGEVVAFQLNAAPDQNPGMLPLVPASKYFIINNYGNNKTFTAPESIKFGNINLETPAYRTTDFRLYQRPSGASGNTWGNELSRSTGFNFAGNSSSVTFGTDNNITTFGQFALSAAPLKAADTVAGKCFTTVDNSYSPIDLGTVPINSNEFSVSCWIKPNGLQKSFSQLIAHDPYPGSQFGFGLGFAFRNYDRNLELVYTDNQVGYGNLSNLIAENDTWSYVVLTYSPTGVTIYLNGAPKVVKSGAMPVIDLSQAPFYVNKDIHGQGGDYKGAIDEVKFYNYALSQEEVREKMHLIQKYPALENGLLKYFQFNQYNSSTGKVPDLMSDFEATIPNTSFITASTAPVATGRVFRNPDVNATGFYYFPGTGVMFYLKSGATYPNGEVVAFQLNAAPDQNPGTLPLVPSSKYFIINNYGDNKTFTAPQWIIFKGLDLAPSYSATDFHLFKRASGAFGATWGNEVSRSIAFNYEPGNSSVAFGADNITSFGQFTLSAASAPNRSSSDLASESNTTSNDNASPVVEFYPNPNKGWGYLNISSPHSKGHVTLYLNDMNGHTVYQTREQLRDSDKTSLMLNLSGLSSGIYILQVRFNTGELITKKVQMVR